MAQFALKNCARTLPTFYEVDFVNDVIIKAENLSKVYKIYEKNIDRIKDAFHFLNRSYGKDFYALRDVSFEIRRGENVGLVGKNGAGKSTLLKIITGVLTPSSGTLQVKGKIASLLELGAGFNPDMSGVENIYMNGLLMGYDRAEMDKKIEDIIAFADIGDFIQQPVKTYSSGMFARLAFSVNAFVEPDILIVDEALSVGDAFFQSKCMDKMKTMIDGGVTVLFVSHDLFAVKNLCQRAFWIESGKIKMDATANEVVEDYRNSIFNLRNELATNEHSTDNEITKEIRSTSKNSGKKINLPISQENLNLNREIFEKNAAYQRMQNGRANFENIQLLNLDGMPISEVIFGQEVVLRMVIKFNEDTPALLIGYHIRNLNGVDLIYNDSRFSDTKAIFDAKANEIYVVDWKFKVELRQELYNFACSMSVPIEETLDSPNLCDYVPLALQFNVICPNKYCSMPGGYVHWHNDMEITKFKSNSEG